MTEEVQLTVPKDEVDQWLERTEERYQRLDDLAIELMDRGDGNGLGPYREETHDIIVELKELEGRIQVLTWIQDENWNTHYSDFEYSVTDFLIDIAQDVVDFVTPSSEETTDDPATVDRKKIRFDEV